MTIDYITYVSYDTLTATFATTSANYAVYYTCSYLPSYAYNLRKTRFFAIDGVVSCALVHSCSKGGGEMALAMRDRLADLQDQVCL